jgi:murein DD-endopeptidase MepM/ murein hydrolase activator NlpD
VNTHSKYSLLTLPLWIVAFASASCVAPAEVVTEESSTSEGVGKTTAALTVSGYGHYCSMTWPDGMWRFASDPNGNDPCGWLNTQASTAGDIRRAGIYDAMGTNSVVARCSDGLPYIYRGNGNDPLTWAYNEALGRQSSGCIFTVAPHNLPIFNSPLSAPPTPGVSIGGFDHIKGYTVNVLEEYGRSGPTNASIVNFKGDARTWAGDHDAYDWSVPEGTQVKAVADGYVVASRDLNTGCSGSLNPIQGEVYIKHKVNRSPSTYDESFVAAYFHLRSRTNLSRGQFVAAGTVLGEVGWVGCSSGSHLHFAVIRTSNAAGSRFPSFSVPDGQENNGWRWTIDPYGWQAPKNIDPRGWRNFPDGALSIYLWKSGQDPATGNWGP